MNTRQIECIICTSANWQTISFRSCGSGIVLWTQIPESIISALLKRRRRRTAMLPELSTGACGAAHHHTKASQCCSADTFNRTEVPGKHKSVNCIQW